jgi:hypothetical protein
MSRNMTFVEEVERKLKHVSYWWKKNITNEKMSVKDYIYRHQLVTNQFFLIN